MKDGRRLGFRLFGILIYAPFIITLPYVVCVLPFCVHVNAFSVTSYMYM